MSNSRKQPIRIVNHVVNTLAKVKNTKEEQEECTEELKKIDELNKKRSCSYCKEEGTFKAFQRLYMPMVKWKVYSSDYLSTCYTCREKRSKKDYIFNEDGKVERKVKTNMSHINQIDDDTIEVVYTKEKVEKKKSKFETDSEDEEFEKDEESKKDDEEESDTEEVKFHPMDDVKEFIKNESKKTYVPSCEKTEKEREQIDKTEEINTIKRKMAKYKQKLAYYQIELQKLELDEEKYSDSSDDEATKYIPKEKGKTQPKEKAKPQPKAKSKAKETPKETSIDKRVGEVELEFLKDVTKEFSERHCETCKEKKSAYEFMKKQCLLKSYIENKKDISYEINCLECRSKPTTKKTPDVDGLRVCKTCSESKSYKECFRENRRECKDCENAMKRKQRAMKKSS